MSAFSRALGIGMIAGAGAGLLAGGWLWRGAGGESVPVTGPVEPRLVGEAPGPAVRREVAPASQVAPGSRAAAPESLDGALITPALLEAARAGIRGGWARRRSDEISQAEMTEALERFMAEVRGLPWRIGDELATRRNQAEAARADAKTGGAFNLLDTLAKGGGPLRELMRDRARLEQLMPRQAAETFVGGEAHVQQPDRALRDGVTLKFPPGVFALNSLLREVRPAPRDVTLAGTGMNETLFLVGSIEAREPLRNFGIRDCTVYSDCAFIDLRLAATVRLERVRILGFDCGAGGSSAIDTGPAVLLARDCRFEGGYGRNPGDGHLFDVRTNALVARFDDCFFSLMRLDGFYSEATVLFVRCTMRQLFARTPDRAAWERSGYVQDCDLEFFTGDPGAIARKDLDDLFPDWEKRTVR